MGKVITVGGNEGPLNVDKPPYEPGVSYRHKIVQYSEREGKDFGQGPTKQFMWRFECEDDQHPEMTGKIAFVYTPTQCGARSRASNKLLQMATALLGRQPMENESIDLDTWINRHVRLRFTRTARPNAPDVFPYGFREDAADIANENIFAAQHAPVQQGAVLPPGWQSHRDANSGKDYYVSPNGQTQWEPPVAPASVPPPVPLAAPAPPPVAFVAPVSPPGPPPPVGAVAAPMANPPAVGAPPPIGVPQPVPVAAQQGVPQPPGNPWPAS